MSLQIETDSEWNPYAEHERTIESLREQLAQKDTEIERLKAEHATAYKLVDYWQKKSASIQAREQQLRAALVIVDNAGDDEWYPYTPERAKTAIGKTIALPQDTSALEAMIQKAGEVMRERCFAACNADKYPNECDKSIAYDCRLAIRTLPGVTLGDLK